MVQGLLECSPGASLYRHTRNGEGMGNGHQCLACAVCGLGICGLGTWETLLLGGLLLSPSAFVDLNSLAVCDHISHHHAVYMVMLRFLLAVRPERCAGCSVQHICHDLCSHLCYTCYLQVLAWMYAITLSVRTAQDVHGLVSLVF